VKKPVNLILIATTILLFILPSAAALGEFEHTVVAQVGADWPMYAHDGGRTGYSASETLDRGYLLWKSALTDYSYPIVADGKVYVRAGLTSLQCLNASTGTIIWTQAVTSEEIDYDWLGVQYPALADGRVYAPWASQPTAHGGLLCLNASTGELIWNYSSKRESSVAVADGKAYLSVWNETYSSSLECLDAANGSQLWTQNTESYGYPLVVAKGRIYAGSWASYEYLSDGYIRQLCLNASSGVVIGYCGQIVAADQDMWLSGGKGGSEYPDIVTIRAGFLNRTYPEVFDPREIDASKIWEYSTPLGLSFPSLAYGRVYFGYVGDVNQIDRPNLNGTLCLNATNGNVLWNYSAVAGMGAPAVADGRVYVGAKDSKIYCLSAFTGSKLWSFTTDGPVDPPIVADGMVYAIGGGRVYAFGSARTLASINYNGSLFPVSVDSNSLVSGLRFSQPDKSVSFNVTGPSGRSAFCNVTIPVSLIGGPYSLLMNGSSVTYTQKSNATHVVLSFTYMHERAGSFIIEVVGATVVSELAPSIQWNKTYGQRSREESGFGLALCLVQTKDGGYALAGDYFMLAGDSHYSLWLIKTDAAGNIQWNRTYVPRTPYAYGMRANTCLIQVKDGGYLLAGNVEDSIGGGGDFWENTYDAWLVRTDASGNMLWNKTYGRVGPMDQVNSVAETSDGGFILAGRADGDAWLFEIDAVGNMQWNRTFGGLQRDRANSVIQTKDDGYALAGYTNSAPDEAGYSERAHSWLVKTDASGNMLWNQTYGGAISYWAESLIQTRDGGYVIFGANSSLGPSWDNDYWLMKTDASGTTQWNKSYSGPGTEIGPEPMRSVIETYNGYALDARTLIKTDLSGNIQWNSTFEGVDIIQTSDGGYALTGGGYVNDWLINGWLIKLAPERSPLVEKNYYLNAGGHNFTLTALTNSSITEFDTSDIVLTRNMSFTVESSWGTSTCNLTIPNIMLGGPYVLMVEGEPPLSSTTSVLNSTHMSLYFTYNGTGKHTAQIIGATAVPEFSLPITVLVYGILTLAVITLKKIRGISKPFHL
jgi:outer membrane protein assembly factor BamB